MSNKFRWCLEGIPPVFKANFALSEIPLKTEFVGDLARLYFRINFEQIH